MENIRQKEVRIKQTGLKHLKRMGTIELRIVRCEQYEK